MKKAVFCLALIMALLPCAVYGAETKIGNISYNINRNAFIKEDNSLWMWGYSDVSLLGDGRKNGEDYAFQPVKVLDGVAMVSNGNNYTMALKTDGTLWGWGYNIYGQIGDGEGGMLSDERINKVKIMDNAAFVSAGQYNTFAIKTDGSLWGWGRNEEGQLGDGTKKSSYFPIKIMDDAIFVTQGKKTAYVVKNDNTLWEIGKNVVKPDDSQVGKDLIAPRKIMDDVVRVAEDMFASRLAVLKTDGSVWVIRDTSMIKPAKVMTGVKDVFSGSMELFALKDDGSLWVFGRLNESNQAVMTPEKVMDGVVSLSANPTTTAVVKEDGSLWEAEDSDFEKAKEIMSGILVDSVDNSEKP